MIRPVLKLTKAEGLNWRKLVAFLEEQKQLQNVDAFVLTLCVKSWSRIEQSLDNLATMGAIQEFENGTRQLSPEQVVYNKTQAEFMGYVAQLGLSPKARKSLLTQLAPPDTADDDPFAAMPGASRD